MILNGYLIHHFYDFPFFFFSLISNSQREDVKFEFPDLFSKEVKKEEENKQQQAVDAMNVKFKKFVDQNKNRPGLPGWYSI